MADRTRVVHCKREPYDVYIGRPSAWGNPFRIGRDGTREEVILAYRLWLQRHPELIEQARRELRGQRLGCYCAPLPCHGDVLAEVADAPEEPTPQSPICEGCGEYLDECNCPPGAWSDEEEPTP